MSISMVGGQPPQTVGDLVAALPRPSTVDRSTGEIRGAYPKEIVAAIAQVMGADLYVQKRGKNAFHGYKYATVGDILDKIQPLMSEAGLVIFQDEGETAFLDDGNIMVTRYQFTLAHTSGAVWPDRPTHTGMSACRNSKGGFDDKSANKCHTAARKYFILGLFQIPTGEDFRQAAHDAEADAHGGDPSNGNGHATTEPYVTAEQKERLVALMKETGSDTKRFLAYLGVPDLDQLPAEYFAKAEQALQKKAKAK